MFRSPKLFLLLVLAVLLLPFVPAIAQDTLRAAPAAVDTVYQGGGGFSWGGLASAIIGGVVAAVFSYFGGHKGAKAGVNAPTSRSGF